ncbi:MAG: hypothetical protein ABIO92_04780, partial [Chloroflexia bacterium]
KGFDSSTGGVPSPILPSGDLWSLPIPVKEEPFRRYEQITNAQESLGSMVNDLTRGKVKPADYAHLDPDLSYNSVPRLEGWRPIFGQAGAAESHLQARGVTTGDVFIFYGWFKQVEYVSGKYKYKKDARDLHVIFGWLQVEQRLSVYDRAAIPPWASEHQHCLREPRSSREGGKHKDSIYLSTNTLQLPDSQLNKPGAGVFKRYDDRLCLTCPGKTRSIWRLPLAFSPEDKPTTLSYHSDKKRWTVDGDHVHLNSVGKGQEFVLDCDDYPETIEWLAGILRLAD